MKLKAAPEHVKQIEHHKEIQFIREAISACLALSVRKTTMDTSATETRISFSDSGSDISQIPLYQTWTDKSKRLYPATDGVKPQDVIRLANLSETGLGGMTPAFGGLHEESTYGYTIDAQNSLKFTLRWSTYKHFVDFSITFSATGPIAQHLLATEPDRLTIN